MDGQINKGRICWATTLLVCSVLISVGVTASRGIVRAAPSRRGPGTAYLPASWTKTGHSTGLSEPQDHIRAARRPLTATLPADLSVLFISREPRYPRYCVDYSSGVPRLCPGTEEAKRFPDPGEPVTMTAAVANQGGAISSETDYAWLVDGMQVEVGSLPELVPREQISLTARWDWRIGPHMVIGGECVAGGREG